MYYLPAVNIPIDAANETVDLGSVGMLLDPGLLAIHQDHRVPSVQLISSQLGSRMNLIQGLAHPFMRFASIQFSFAEVCLNGDISICCINYFSHIYITSELCSPDPFLSPGVYHWWLGSSWELCPVFQFTSLPNYIIQFIYLT